ncbi:hypothetical protein BH09BAC4_BH09BAC4_05070 [soil metagenome]
MKMMLLDIKEQVEALGKRINTPHNLYPTYGRSADGDRPHIEIDSSGKLHFVVVERGQELERQTTTVPNDLLFWIFDVITFSMACAFELENRKPNQDFRHILFSKQEDLLGCLSANWQEKKRINHNLILAKHPFSDALLHS